MLICFFENKIKKSNRNTFLRNKTINKFSNLYKNMLLIQYSFLFYLKTTQTKLKSRMMNLELKDFSLYDFLNLSLINIYEPFLLSISKKNMN